MLQNASRSCKKVGILLWNVTILGREKMADLWKATPYIMREQLLPFQISGGRLDQSINDAEPIGDPFGKKIKLDPTSYHIPKEIPDDQS